MKKGLLLSVVASGLIYAGGDIAPVAPVTVPAVAPAACDFYGSIGVRYETTEDKYEDVNGVETQLTDDLFDQGSSYGLVYVNLGVDKQIGYGFGVGAEVSAKTGYAPLYRANRAEQAQLSQLYVTYKYNNTLIKAGRQALPKSLSPMAWSDSTVGVKDQTFNSVLVVNTDIANTTIAAAWVHKIVPFGSDAGVRVNGDNGILMLAAQYNGIANTTITGTAYYAADDGLGADFTAAWGTVESKFSGFNVGLQGVYSNLDATGLDSTFGVAAYIGGQWGAFDAKLTAAYINDGDAPLNPLGGTSAFWGNVGYAPVGADIDGSAAQSIVKLDVGYKLPENYGKIYAGVAYDKYDDANTNNKDEAIAARVGYSFNVKGVAAKVEYRYTEVSGTSGDKLTRNRVRVEGIYKF